MTDFSRRMRLWAMGGSLVLGILAMAMPSVAQDTTTMLSKFLADLRAGTLGVLQAVTAIKLGNGTAGVPALTFTNQVTSGWYSRGAGVTGWVNATNSTSAANFEIGNDYIETVTGTPGSTGLLFSTSASDAGSTVQMGVSSPTGNALVVSNATPTVGVRMQVGLPTIGACGTSPSVAAGSADTRGRVTVGSDGPATCVVNFAGTWANAPECYASVITTTAANARAIAMSATTTALTFTPASAFVASSVVGFWCAGQP